LCVALVIAGAIAGVAWLSREHDRLAADNQRLMVQGAVQNLTDTLQTITLDFAIWPSAVEALARDDGHWVWKNIGISAAETETTDLMMVVPTGGRPAYGWTPGMGAAPSFELLPQEVVARMMAALDEVPILERHAPTEFVDVGGELWLLSSARIVSNETAQVPTDDAVIPRLLFGFRLSPEMVASLGKPFLIDDLALTRSPPDGVGTVAIPPGAAAPIGHLAWQPFQPGPRVLQTLGLPLLAGIAGLIVVSLICGRFILGIAGTLERAYHRARAADIAKTGFLANVSHELRTPMNGIIGIARLLEGTRLDSRQRQMLDMLSAAAEAQMHLITDLLDITMIESGRVRFRTRPFLPATALSEAADIQRIEAARKGLDLRVEIEDDAGVLLGDADRFRQILQNLLGNAIRVTTGGAVVLRLRSRPGPRVTRLTVEVEDTGPGIAPEDRERIFERFVQLDGIDERTHRGAGLGLTITRSLVEMMGGRLSVESELGKGSVFRVDIPFETAGHDALRDSAA